MIRKNERAEKKVEINGGPASAWVRVVGALTVVGVQERAILDSVSVVTGAIAVLASECPELGTRGARGVPDQVSTVNLGWLVILVAKCAVVFHQLVDSVAVGVHTVVEA